MTDRWLNWVLAVVVVVGLAGVAVYEQPRLAEERAEFLDQDVVQLEDAPTSPDERDPWELRRREAVGVPDGEPSAAGPAPSDVTEQEQPEPLDAFGVSASHPAAVEVGMQVLDAGGNAVDAAIAVAYALGVVEPFGSGIGGGGAMVVMEPGGDPRSFDYREVAPASGELPASDIGVPGFVAGMAHVHEIYGTFELADLIEPAARLAEDGVEVTTYLEDRLQGAAWRLPIHLAPRLFPNGSTIGAGETLRQPELAATLRLLQDQGPEVAYTGELGIAIAEAVSGLEPEDLAAYEVVEVEPAIGSFGGYEVIASGAPTSGPTVVQILQIAEALDVPSMDLDGPDAQHALAQAWRLALSDRTVFVGDPTVEDVPLEQLLSADHAAERAARVPADGFAEIDEDDPALFLETDTTHVTIVDRDGTMVSMTNTLSNFFGSGLPVAGFFLNDQLKNFSRDDESVNVVAPGKRPRSFVAPTIVAQDGRPLLGIGSPGGRRIPNVVAQVVLRWVANGGDLQAATDAPRLHVEGDDLELEQAPAGAAAQDLRARGYTIVTDFPTEEYFGGVQALLVDPDALTVSGVADDRRIGEWESADDGG